MSWRIAQQNGKFRIWSTISDDWLTDWIDRKEVIRFYYDDMFTDFKKRVIAKYKSFPNFCTSNETGNYIHDEEGHIEHQEWLERLASTKNAEEYYTLIDQTFNKIVADLDEEAQA